MLPDNYFSKVSYDLSMLGMSLSFLQPGEAYYVRICATNGRGVSYFAPNAHVVAARITAENTGEGFKPTSISVESIKFQSISNVWGYFSVGANREVHDFTDSQFGHSFAKDPTREHAREALILALKGIEVRREIRITVEYLVQLLEMKAFKENTSDTS